MLKLFYTVADFVNEKNIYIYGINRTSITVFTNLAIWEGDVSGFVDDGERYIGEYFMNRPIKSVSQVKADCNAIVVISDVLDKKAIEAQIGEETPIFYCNEVIAPNKELRKKQVCIYGIGMYGEIMYKQCCEYGIKVKAACVTQKGNITNWNGLSVYNVSDMNVKDCVFVIATIHLSNCKQMMEMVKEYHKDVYVYSYISKETIREGRFFHIIGNAVSTNKKIWLYGKNRDLKENIVKMLSRYSVEIQGEISNLYEAGYVSVNDALVVITENDEYEVEQASDILDSLGFSLENWNYTSLACETVKCKDAVKTAPDLLLEWSNVSNSKDYPGFIVHGENNQHDIKIMVLGNSVSTEGIYRTNSWVELFYEKLVNENYHVTVFNGATSGYGITRELLQLLRDGAYMGLDYVIGFSGVNNITDHGVKNYFSGDLGRQSNPALAYGIESKESLYAFWNRSIKVMKSIVELYGAKSFFFLQPMPVKERMSLSEAVMHEVQDARKNILEFRRQAKSDKKNTYINMIDIFDDKTRMYIDNIHFSNEGSQLIADFIFNVITKSGEIKKINK